MYNDTRTLDGIASGGFQVNVEIEVQLSGKTRYRATALPGMSSPHLSRLLQSGNIHSQTSRSRMFFPLSATTLLLSCDTLGRTAVGIRMWLALNLGHRLLTFENENETLTC